ncbi:ABC transporter ATP-binding protein [Pseudonocardia kunmingensis]|uniref:Amino acid/amide ABC transporter ATP-binding protein 1 (HAAT family) n=1 Tax=Pseudonocardia kunmingensis TaxID=630975 RepID=A0A543DVL4_9PSEU|nr:ABC transporter ATP-binding protein [Pseudonocardia kunmingensis]TQM13353.1 amino acid/amide ABC transporter ATP-binding protein 1 (HAAT family) [Pseudonocardia kunmingensis]
MIDVRSATVQFGGVTALKEVDLAVDRGRVCAVIGPNGSGKTTLFNTISGFVSPTAGSVLVDGRDVTRVAADGRARLGLARTFQTPRVDVEATVRETVLCGFLPSTRSGLLAALIRTPRVQREERRLATEVDELLERFGLEGHAGHRLSELPMGLVRIVDVARAMAMRPKYLLLDEPAAGLTTDEQQLLVSEIRRVAGEGVGVLLVEHNFVLVQDVSEHVVVLERGAVLAEGAPGVVAEDPRVVDVYLGVTDEDSALETT